MTVSDLRAAIDGLGDGVEVFVAGDGVWEDMYHPVWEVRVIRLRKPEHGSWRFESGSTGKLAVVIL